MQMVLMSDLVIWGVQFLTRELARQPEEVCRGVVVAGLEPNVPAQEWPKKLVIVGDSGSNDGDTVQSEATLRVSTVAATPDNPYECVQLARIVHAVMRTSARNELGNPVAKVLSSSGPFWADENQYRARRFSMFDLSVVGEVYER